MLTEEQAANAYALATDGCRRSVLGTRDNAPQWQRVKPDPETNPLAGLDCENVPIWDQGVPRATPASEYLRSIAITAPQACA
jgi:hypothetical protein